MSSLPPWVNGPFELLVHAEVHLRQGGDFDRRIALISLDNAIEVAVTTYLTLNPTHRGGRSYDKQKVDRWLYNYSSKLNFLECELKSRKETWIVEKDHILWIHYQRNLQYHGESSGIPEKMVLDIARKAALWVFCFLFEISEVESELENAIISREFIPEARSPDKRLDDAIDSEYGIIEIGDQILSCE